MIRVLVVDDDVRVAQLHCEYVERLAGFRIVGQSHSGAEAVVAARGLTPDLVLLDFYLPDVHGLEVLRRLRELKRSPDVLAITAARDPETLRAAIQAGVVHYLVKPFRFSALADKLASYAAARERIQRMAEADQSEVDRIFGALRSGSEEPLPKGLSDVTLEQIVGALRGAGSGLSAGAVAEAAGVSRVTARRYLDHLCRMGRVELTLRYGVGRPEHHYRLTPARLSN